MPMSGRRWRACALATVRRSNCTCGFPAYSFHEGTNYEIRSRPCRVGPAPHLSGRSGPAVSSDDDVRVFPKGTDPPHRPYSSAFPALPSCLRLPPSPTHSRRRLLGHTAFTVLVVSGRRWRACALATVRRSNCTCGFPAYSFHEGTNYEIRSRPCRVGPAPHLSG